MYKNSYKKFWEKSIINLSDNVRPLVELEIIKNKIRSTTKIILGDDFEISISTNWDFVVLSVMWFLSKLHKNQGSIFSADQWTKYKFIAKLSYVS